MQKVQLVTMIIHTQNPRIADEFSPRRSGTAVDDLQPRETIVSSSNAHGAVALYEVKED